MAQEPSARSDLSALADVLLRSRLLYLVIGVIISHGLVERIALERGV